MSSKYHYNSRHRSRSPSRKRSRSRSPHRNSKYETNRRSKSRSPFRHPSKRRSLSRDRYHKTNGHRRDSQERHHHSRPNIHDNHRPQTSHKKLSHEDEFWEMRRQQRELISLHECPLIWGKSPMPNELNTCHCHFT